MTIFKFPKKTIVLKCFTDQIQVANVAPIKMASAFYPDWWKKLGKSHAVDEISISPTAKMCTGIIRQYENSAMMPLWSELNIGIGSFENKGYRYQYADRKSKIEEHPEYQRGDFLPGTHFQHLKLITPWAFECDEPVNFLLTQPTWNFDLPHQMMVLPGTLDFKYQHGTNINMIFPRDIHDRKLGLPLGLPIGHIIPLSERKLKIEVEVDQEKFLSLRDKSGAMSTFIGKYATNRRAAESNEESKPKCPFGFGKK